MAKPPPPPPPPPLPALYRTIAEMDRRLRDYQEALRRGVNPNDLAARGLQSRVREQENFLSKQFAGLSPQQQQQHLPLMQQVEHRRKQVEEEEIKRRKEMVDQLGRGNSALQAFARQLAAGNPAGAVGAGIGGLGVAGGVLGTLATTLTGVLVHALREYESEISRGGRALSPGGARTEELSRQLREMQDARRAGERERQNAAATAEQLRAQATQMGMRRTQDPNSYLSSPFGAAGQAYFRARAAEVGVLMAGGSQAQARAARERELSDYFARWIREHGGTPRQGQNGQPALRELPMELMARSRYTTGEQFYESLANAGMEASGQQLSNEILREQMNAANLLLTNIANNTSRIQGPAFGD